MSIGEKIAGKYKIEKHLGHGSFGTVYLVEDEGDQSKKVAKRIFLGDFDDDSISRVVDEARMLSRLDHPNIVGYFDSFVNQDGFHLIIEFCNNGDLKSKIMEQQQKGEYFDEKTIADWFYQLMRAIDHVHKFNCIHRDISPGNIFITNGTLIKLGDFGCSYLKKKSLDIATSFKGTPLYMSPEMINLQGCDTKTDVWSAGCVLFELCTLKTLFAVQGLVSLSVEITTKEIPDLPDNFSPHLNAVFKMMVVKDPQDRWSAAEVLADPLFDKKILAKTMMRKMRRLRKRSEFFNSSLPMDLKQEEFVASSPSESTIDDETKDWFLNIDYEQNGSISEEEIQAALISGSGLRFSSKQIRILFDLFDKNKDDCFVLEEFSEILNFIREKRKEFHWIAGQNNDSIDHFQLKNALLVHLGLNISDDVVDILMKRFGCRNHINFDGYLLVAALFVFELEQFNKTSTTCSWNEYIYERLCEE